MACAPEGELLTIKKAAAVLGVAPSTIHRLLNDGIIAGEQLTPGAPWRIPNRRTHYAASQPGEGPIRKFGINPMH
jgi:excisionase family DNA binding protein